MQAAVDADRVQAAASLAAAAVLAEEEEERAAALAAAAKKAEAEEEEEAAVSCALAAKTGRGGHGSPSEQQPATSPLAAEETAAAAQEAEEEHEEMAAAAMRFRKRKAAAAARAGATQSARPPRSQSAPRALSPSLQVKVMPQLRRTNSQLSPCLENEAVELEQVVDRHAREGDAAAAANKQLAGQLRQHQEELLAARRRSVSLAPTPASAPLVSCHARVTLYVNCIIWNIRFGLLSTVMCAVYSRVCSWLVPE